MSIQQQLEDAMARVRAATRNAKQTADELHKAESLDRLAEQEVRDAHALYHQLTKKYFDDNCGGK